MGVSATRIERPAGTEETIYLPLQTTTTLTPFVAHSISTATGKGYKVIVDLIAIRADTLLMRGGQITSVFRRASGGNIIRDGSLVSTIAGLLTGSIDVVANVTSNTIDVTLTGLNLTTIYYDIKLTIKTTNLP